MPQNFETKEGTGAKYTATLKDADGTVIPLANLTSIKLTLYNYANGAAINSRTSQDVKNTNNVTIHATSGLLTWLIQAADNPIVDTNIDINSKETHVALFEYVYVGNGTPGKHEVHLLCKNLGKVTQS